MCGYIIYLFPEFFPKSLRNYAPDLFWAISLTIALTIVRSFNSNQIVIIISCVLLGLSYEMGQYFNLFSGTFDFYDIIIYAIGSILGILISRITKPT